MAQKNGAATWTLGSVPEGDLKDAEKMEAIQAGIGPELANIAKWTGLRAAEGDRRSIFLMTRCIAEILNACREIISQNEVAKN